MWLSWLTENIVRLSTLFVIVLTIFIGILMKQRRLLELGKICIDIEQHCLLLLTWLLYIGNKFSVATIMAEQCCNSIVDSIVYISCSTTSLTGCSTTLFSIHVWTRLLTISSTSCDMTMFFGLPTTCNNTSYGSDILHIPPWKTIKQL